ncbi:helix-turn-helix transcriptional regulator [Aliarcobacter butzleri]|uniref:helix-turn-helix transcriptional regulator n=1 Tax=Aliarcobacter butzleri TaxID=28197 RepID=UPI0012607498|nr:AlpA family phage regulatory protein [Aliarcobacter butzleri]MCG3704313.1 AlpA family phage regulatory protein [Aliarcobacter butzleri]MCT7595602.1 AlpA family phage regulatory protein [Aliarcobacter butzleri]MCT7645400.1 AlpA family phage regulatory protein [Aliarcobacter butzleri]MDK2082882.1 AlpA family phage regulatory protein [Aliarcobacter butzleri]
MEEKLLRIKGVREYIPLPVSTIYAKMKSLKFPQQKKYGGTAMWSYLEVKLYMDMGEEAYHQYLLKQKELEKVS